LSQPALDAGVTRPIAQHHALGKDDAPGGFFEGATEQGAFGSVQSRNQRRNERRQSGAPIPMTRVSSACYRVFCHS
jgi:hypothetical protein